MLKNGLLAPLFPNGAGSWAMKAGLAALLSLSAPGLCLAEDAPIGDEPIFRSFPERAMFVTEEQARENDLTAAGVYYNQLLLGKTREDVEQMCAHDIELVRRGRSPFLQLTCVDDPASGYYTAAFSLDILSSGGDPDKALTRVTNGPNSLIWIVEIQFDESAQETVSFVSVRDRLVSR